MNRLSKAVLLAILGLTSVPVAQAESFGDLIVGFTTQAGNDRVFDLGSFTGSNGGTLLHNGETWSAATLGITGGTFHWGVIGSISAAAAGTAYDTLYCTVPSGTPGSLTGNSAWNAANTGINTLVAQLPGGAANFAPNTGFSVAATQPGSWNNETLNGPLATDFHNVYANPNVVNQAVANLYQINDNGSAPVLVGTFSLSTLGVLTFNVGVVAPVANFTGTPTVGFAPLKVAFTDVSSGTITNWLWTFGDGHSITNLTSSNVTNTYATAGNYTVSLVVTGNGLSNTNTKTSYITVSPQPSLGAPVLSGTNFIFGGINDPAGVQYRILWTTNIAQAITSWKPVYTNTFLSNGSFSYTNSTANSGGFFRLVSP